MKYIIFIIKIIFIIINTFFKIAKFFIFLIITPVLNDSSQETDEERDIREYKQRIGKYSNDKRWYDN